MEGEVLELHGPWFWSAKRQKFVDWATLKEDDTESAGGKEESASPRSKSVPPRKGI
jgi:hypothetical protein